MRYKVYLNWKSDKKLMSLKVHEVSEIYATAKLTNHLNQSSWSIKLEFLNQNKTSAKMLFLFEDHPKIKPNQEWKIFEGPHLITTATLE